jgi:hypothetical protein
MDLPPSDDKANVPGDVVTFWQAKQGQLEEMVRFTQANLVSAISGQIAAIPVRERLTQADLFLPADSLSNMHTLILTLTALYSNASVAFNSAASRSPDLVLATQGVAPTVIVTSPATLLRTHEESTRRLGGGLAKLSHLLATNTLTQRGVHSVTNFLSAFAAGARPRIGTTPGKLRLVYVAERIGGDTPLLSTLVLSNLRVYTGARVVYALTAARVSGVVAQTALFDYRITPGVKAHFGVPSSSVEIFLEDMGVHKTTDETIEGQVSC